MSRKTESVLFALFCEYLWLYIKYSKPFSTLSNCLEKSLSFVIEHRSLFLLWLSIEVSFSCDWAKEVSWSCLWALRSLLLCVWETCNLVLDFSETLLGSARGTGLLPVCGRNLYNCFVFFLSLHSYYLSAALRLWTLSDSDPENRFHNVRRRSFWKHNSTPPPPLLVFFSHLQHQHNNSQHHHIPISIHIKHQLIRTTRTHATTWFVPRQDF